MKANANPKPIDAVCAELIDEFRARPTPRAGSLITTVFGDSIAPRGGEVWLGSLIALLDDFGISERLVRTSVFRLAKDGWLESEQHGRRSYYRLTADGRERFQAATHRIYGEPRPDWDGQWCLLFVSALDAGDRDVLRRECGWLGFGALTSNVFAHPAPDVEALAATLDRLGVRDDVVIMESREVGETQGMRRLASDAWGLAELDEGYAGFVEHFRPARAAIERRGEVAPATAFALRTLLIQEYRKLLLRDPQLPAELLPDDWHGAEAYEICRDLYRAVYEPCDTYLGETVETAAGNLPKPDRAYFRRFGGLMESR